MNYSTCKGCTLSTWEVYTDICDKSMHSAKAMDIAKYWLRVYLKLLWLWNFLALDHLQVSTKVFVQLLEILSEVALRCWVVVRAIKIHSNLDSSGRIKKCFTRIRQRILKELSAGLTVSSPISMHFPQFLGWKFENSNKVLHDFPPNKNGDPFWGRCCP